MSTPLTAWTALTARVPNATMKAARSHAAKHYRRLEVEHGRGGARRIWAEALAALAPPLPTEPLEALAPLAAAAEICLRMRMRERERELKKMFDV